jgi:regulator of cell morphogenesis and NO signaling
MENDYSVDQVMVRYNIEKAHHVLYSYDELKSINVDIDFIHQLLKLFEDERSFKADDFDKFSLEVIVDYIRKTHTYYLSKKLLEIEQSINLLLQNYPEGHPLLQVLHSFYSRYKAHLSQHIAEEEHTLLPYVLQMEQLQTGAIKGTFNNNGFSLKSFLDSHHDVEDDLQIARKAILEYNPPATNETPYRILLSQLQVFEKDLAVHALIEDYVLVPRALNLERQLQQN